MHDKEIEKIDCRYSVGSNPSFFMYIITLFVPMICFCTAFFAHKIVNSIFDSLPSGETYKITHCLVIAFIIIIFIGLWFSIYLVITVVILLLPVKQSSSFICIYIQSKLNLLVVAILITIISNGLKLISSFCTDDEQITRFTSFFSTDRKNDFSLKLDQYLNLFIKEEKIASHLPITTIFFLVAVFESIIRFYVQYTIYHQCFKKNLMTSRHNLRCLKVIERKKEGRASSHKLTENEISDLYNYITTKDHILYGDIQVIFNDDQRAQSFFDLFDVNNDGKITRSEFNIRFNEIQSRSGNFLLAYKKSRNGIKKLKFITFPIGLYLGFSVISTSGQKNSFGTVVASFASLSFMLGPALADLFKNIFQIFFSRPFDVGDTIFFQGEKYQVKDLGFLYTQLEARGTVVYMANECFKRDAIVNLRDSTKFPAQIKIYWKHIFDNTNINNFKCKLTSFLVRNKNFFENKFRLEKFESGENYIICELTVFIFMHEINFKHILIQKEKLINYMMKYSEELDIQFMT